MIIPEGHILVTGYVPTNEIVFHSECVMSVTDVKEKITQQTHIRGGTAYPVPIGDWRDGRFHLWDGRHRYIAALLLNRKTMLVGWVIRPETDQSHG